MTIISAPYPLYSHFCEETLSQDIRYSLTGNSWVLFFFFAYPDSFPVPKNKSEELVTVDPHVCSQHFYISKIGEAKNVKEVID